MLSAQCTDARVNVVTKDLFKKYPDMEAFAKADLEELEQDIKPTGVLSQQGEKYHRLRQKDLPGIRRESPQKPGGSGKPSRSGKKKLPNVIRGNIFHEPSVVVDTHVKRISRRLGLTKETDPEKIEQDLMKVLPKDHWILLQYTDHHLWPPDLLCQISKM